MVDYVKILLRNVNKDRLLQKLDFQTDVHFNTGETAGKYFCEIHYCTIEIFESGNIFFKGSLHKLWNSLQDNEEVNQILSKKRNLKGFNGNDYGFYQLQKTINYLTELFECQRSDMIIQNIEFGLNLETTFNPRLFIKGLLYFKAHPFEKRHYKNYAQCKLSEYIIKIYNKGFQYNLNNNILRIEIRFRKSNNIEPFGIKTMNDLNQTNIKKALEKVLKVFKEVVYYDYTIRKNEPVKRLKKNQVNYMRDLYFLEELNNKQRFTARNNLNEIIKNHSDNLRAKIVVLFNKKMELLYRESE